MIRHQDPFRSVRAALVPIGLILVMLLAAGAMSARCWSLALNTLLLAGATCAISLLVGIPLAALLLRTDLPGRRPALALLGAMLLVPVYLQAAAWQAGFGLQGWATLAAGGSGVWPVVLHGWTGALWVHAAAALPWVVLIVGAGLRLIEPELEEQALLDGRPAAVFLRVTLPAAAAAIGVAALWIAILTAGQIAATDLFGVRTFAEEIYTQAALGPQPQGSGWRGLPDALSGTVLVLWLVLAGLLLLDRLTRGHRPPSLRRQWVFSLGRFRLPAAVLVALLLLVIVAVPLGNLVYKAGIVVAQTDAGRLRWWSPAKCLQIVAESPWRYRREFGWSLLIGSLAAAAATVAAAGLAWIARGGRWKTRAVFLAMAVCLATPGPVLGLALIRFFNRPELPPLVYLYDQSIAAPWLAQTIRALPLATLVLWYAMRSIPQTQLDASRIDGAGPFRRWWYIALGSRLPAIGLAWLVAFVVALGDLSATLLVVPPGVNTLPIRIFGLLHYGVEDQVAGICLVLAILFAVLTFAAVWLAARSGLWRRSSRRL